MIEQWQFLLEVAERSEENQMKLNEIYRDYDDYDPNEFRERKPKDGDKLVHTYAFELDWTERGSCYSSAFSL